MCGRFAFYSPKDEIETRFHVTATSYREPAYNLAPSMAVPVIKVSESKDKTLSYLEWGLLPSLSKTRKQAQINARCETLHEKPFFRSSFKKRRCLVLANGWFEWQTNKERKQPYYFEVPDKKLLCLAGIWSRNTLINDTIESVAILTCPAKPDFLAIHPRMPLVLNDAQQSIWLSQTPFSYISESAIQTTQTIPLHAYPVSTYVNSPKNQDANCIKPIE